MVRLSKQTRKRAQSPRKHRKPSPKTGSLRDALPKGFKEHANGLVGDVSQTIFIPKVR